MVTNDLIQIYKNPNYPELELHKKPCVYLIECEGLYKIGCTDNLLKRFLSFYSTFPIEPKFIGCELTLNYKNREAEYHQIFKDERSHGEWFKLCLVDIVNCLWIMGYSENAIMSTIENNRLGRIYHKNIDFYTYEQIANIILNHHY